MVTPHAVDPKQARRVLIGLLLTRVSARQQGAEAAGSDDDTAKPNELAPLDLPVDAANGGHLAEVVAHPRAGTTASDTPGTVTGETAKGDTR